MAPAGLEIFRFTVYVFVPIGFFYYFNLPDFYNRFVKPDIVRSTLYSDREGAL